MKLRAALAALLLLASTSSAQVPGTTRRTMFANYDVASGVAIYGLYPDLVASQFPLKTTGSSTTVSEVNASDNTFAGYGIGDIIAVTRTNGTTDLRRVTGIGGVPDNVTVDTAVDWSGSFPFSYRRWTIGTGANTGWFSVGSCDEKSLLLSVTTFNATSITFTVQGRQLGAYGALVTTILTYQFGAAGDQPIPILEHMDDLRVGVQIAGDAGTNAVSATLDCRAAR